MLRYVIKVCGQNIITSDRPDTQNHCVHCISDLSFQKLSKLIWCPQLFNVLTLSRKKQSLSEFEPGDNALHQGGDARQFCPLIGSRCCLGHSPLTPWPPDPHSPLVLPHTSVIMTGFGEESETSWVTLIVGGKCHDLGIRGYPRWCVTTPNPHRGGGVSQMYCFDQNL